MTGHGNQWDMVRESTPAVKVIADIIISLFDVGSSFLVYLLYGTNTRIEAEKSKELRTYLSPRLIIQSKPQSKQARSSNNKEEASSRGFPSLQMAGLATAELCDTNAGLLASGELRVLQPVFRVYGQRRAFSGPVMTLKVFEDNSLVREALESRGEGRVLVVDGGGSMRCGMVGGNLGLLAQNMGWAGIVVNGCIRDVDEINGCDIGVRALASHPVKSNKRGIGERHVPVHVAGILIRDGEWLYADSDGILVSNSELSL